MRAGIAGAGITGRLLAFILNDAGWEVTLFDHTREGENCSNVAVGLLTPVAELEKAHFIIYQLGYEALDQHWPKLLKKIDPAIYFQKTGTLILSHPADQTELSRFINNISHKIEKTTSCKRLTTEEVGQLEPELEKFTEAYFFPEEGRLDNQSLMQSLERFLKNKINWKNQAYIKNVSPKKIIFDDRTDSFDWVFDCRGMGGKTNFNDLRGIRGEVLWLEAPEVNITRQVRFLHPRYCIYIVPRPHHQYLIGATEIESEDYSPISVKSTLEMLTAVHSVHTGFAEARVMKTLTQCRPTLPDHLPKIKYSEGAIAINGLYRHGFLIGPALLYDILTYLKNGISAVRYPSLWEEGW